jgi:small subunit ribosomal protein S2
MAIVSMKALLESGVHFGHRTNKWDPRMKPYIFTERNGIHIIDLQQTVKLLNQAHTLIRDAVAEGKVVLFIGTKRQAQETIVEEATRCGMPYVTERWLGGMLTNWSTIYQRIQELERLEHLRDSGEINRLTKKEGLLIERKIKRLEIYLSGIRALKRLPDLLFVVDVCREEAAVHEANLLNIPILALVDTNCNPQNIDYVIPSNDDAIRAIKLLVGKVAEAVLEGKAARKEQELAEEEAQAESLTPATQRPLPVALEDELLEEEDLLGEATLAKLSTSRKLAEEESEEEEEQEQEKAEEKNKTRHRKESKETEVTEELAEEQEAEAESAAEPQAGLEEAKASDKKSSEAKKEEKGAEPEAKSAETKQPEVKKAKTEAKPKAESKDQETPKAQKASAGRKTEKAATKTAAKPKSKKANEKKTEK